MLVIANGFKTSLQAAQLGLLRTLTLHLFQNDITPDGTNVVADFVEATFPGYDFFALTMWSPPYLNVNNDSQTDPPGVVWKMSGSSPTNMIYGFYVTDANGNLAWSDRNEAGPVLMGGVGAVYGLTASFLLGTATSPL